MRYRATLEFDGFGLSSLREEAARQGVTLDELLVHAAMYYLADCESGRIGHRVLKLGDDELATARSRS